MSRSEELAGRNALVTGAGAGIGRATAELLAARGMRVALLARREERLREVAESIRSRAGAVEPVSIVADAARPGAAAVVAEQVRDAFGTLHGLVNNVGGSPPFAEGGRADEQWDEVFRLNLTFARELTEALLPSLARDGSGGVVSVTGGGAWEPTGTEPARAAKAALQVWSKGLARTVGPLGIRVNCVSPGVVLSGIVTERLLPTEEEQRRFAVRRVPLRRLGEPADCAEAIAFLLSDGARWITGETLHVDGGMRLSAF